jgi:hypothetical protein
MGGSEDFVKPMERDRERDRRREADRQRDGDRQTDREIEQALHLLSTPLVTRHSFGWKYLWYAGRRQRDRKRERQRQRQREIDRDKKEGARIAPVKHAVGD